MTYIDLETRSLTDLEEAGSYAYVQDPTTEVISAVAYNNVEDHWYVYCPRHQWSFVPECFVEEMRAERVTIVPTLDNIPADGVFVAHNGNGFDRLVWEKFASSRPKWLDTMQQARIAGLPGGLDALAKRLLGRGKDARGKTVLDLLSKYTIRDGKVEWPVGTQPLWEQLLEYNKTDVELLVELHPRLPEMPATERAVCEKDYEINRRGVRIDLKYTAALIDAWGRAKGKAAAAFKEMTGGKVSLTSVPQMQKWCRLNGVNLDSLESKRLKEALDDPEGELADHPEVCEALRLRAVACRGTEGKLETILRIAALAPEQRVRGLLVYAGAHTGRFTSRQIQLHNMASGDKDYDLNAAWDEYDRTAIIAEEDDKRLLAMTRGVIVPREGKKLIIADLSQIECRVVAWLAGQLDLLEAFRSGTDPYLKFGSALYGRTITKADKFERAVAKQAVLGCGYQMGWERFRSTCAQYGIVVDEAEARRVIKLYRDSHRDITSLWAKYQQAALRAITEPNCVEEVGRCEWEFDSRRSTLKVRLPSGRRLYYHDAQVQLLEPKFSRLKGLNLPPQPTVTYVNNRGITKETYGGSWAENISQAVARDILFEAVNEIPNVIFHVHDEVIVEGDEADAATVAAELTRPRPWHDGLPVACEVEIARRYKK